MTADPTNVLAPLQLQQEGAPANDVKSSSWQWERGVPCLDDVQTFLRCRRTAEFSSGDHTLIVGAVVAGWSGAVPPLAYVNRGFDWRLA